MTHEVKPELELELGPAILPLSPISGLLAKAARIGEAA
jgi:hypothetical protein